MSAVSAPPQPGPVPLPGVTSGEGGPTVVLVHGFTQTHVSWEPVATALARDHRVLSVDAPGHGMAGDIRATLADGAASLVAAGGAALYVGYSMGGRLALRAALDHPDLVRGLVLLGATAGIDTDQARRDRRAADDALATRLERQGVSVFLDRWLAQPLFTGLDISSEDRAARLANDPAGLASSLRRAGTGSMDPPWWPELGDCTVPTLALAGAEDPKFRTLAERIVAGLAGRAEVDTIAGAGHAAHLSHAGAVAERIRSFVTSFPQPE